MSRLIFLIPLVFISDGCGAIFNSPIPAKCNYTLSPFGGGSGTPSDPYTICTLAHLTQVQNYLSNSFKQYADLDLGGNISFTPIGSSTTPFTGNYDGNNHKVSNWIYSDTTTGYAGFFAALNGSTIQNLKLENFQIMGISRVGILTGAVIGTTVTTVSSITILGGTINTSGPSATFVGSIAGANSNRSTINVTLSSSSAVISDAATGSFSRIGGLIGLGTNLNLSQVSVTGNVNCTNSTGICRAGGLIGEFYGNSTLVQSYFSATLSSLSQVGGLAAVAGTAGIVSISDSYSTGSVQGGSNGISYSGGIVGLVGSGEILTFSRVFAAGQVSGGPSVTGGILGKNLGLATSTSSYWDIQATTQSSSAETGGMGLSTSNMQIPSNFTGWDFTSIWNPPSSGIYPTLR